MLKERYPLPLADDAIDLDSGAEEPDGGDGRAQRRLSELGDLPSTQPMLATPLPQPFDASAFAVTLVQDAPHAPPSSALAPPAPVSPALYVAPRAPVTKPSVPKPKAAPHPSAPAAPAVSASETLGEQGGAAAPPPKRKRSENEVEEEAVPLPWTVPAIQASNALAAIAASPALTLADARSALVLCAPSGGSTLVRAGSGVYIVDTTRLLAATQSDLGTPVAVMLAKLTGLVDERNEPLLQTPHWRPGTPALPPV